METDKIKVLSEVADTVLDEPVVLTVDVRPQSRLHALLMKWKLLPEKKVFQVRPICMGSLIRISRLILSIDAGKVDFKNMLESNYRFVDQYAETAAQVIAIAITNSKQKPSGRLVKFILHNFSSSELLSTILIVVRQMGVQNFMSSIISLRGLSVLEDAVSPEVSPTGQGSQIAPGS
jgi:hypothetical protein